MSSLETDRRTRGAELGYRPQLDALRALAVGGVLYAHAWHPPKLLDLPLGNWGVRLFFVISGFLISGILFRARDDAPSSGGVGRQWRVFYVRRVLRIFPLYYATLAIAWLANIPDVRHEIGWHLLYLSNVYFVRLGEFGRWTGHFWSLSVEEQFYLVWPALALLLPRRALGPLILAAIGVGPLSRWGLQSINWVAPWALAPAMFDSLGMGALLAWSQWRAGEGVGYVPPWLRAAVRPALIAFLLLHFGKGKLPHGWTFDFLFEDTAAAVVYAWLVARAAAGWAGRTGRVLSWPPLTYLGRISYGIYMLQIFGWYVGLQLFSRLGVDSPPELPKALLYSGLTVGFAALSWHFFERPINDLKRIFPYHRGAPLAAPAAGAASASTPAA
jgi:peptidoglycan/LPS O-acetylase OafA/YrhL